jgi:hypothetical protein
MNAQQALYVVSKEPWWETPPGPDETDDDVNWGYLEQMSDGTFRFNPSTPTQDEIANRKSCRTQSQP